MDSTNSVPPAANVGTFDHLQPALQAPQHGHPGNPLGHPQQTAPAGPLPAQWGTFHHMRNAKRWLVWTQDKQPFYVDGSARRGKLDSNEDIQRLATFEQACNLVGREGDRFAGVGFALGPDGSGSYWQGIDLDEVPEELSQRFVDELPGYVERSPSGTGIHAIGYGRHFTTLGSNGTGFEAYAEARYFTVTGDVLKGDGPPTCIAEYVEQRITRGHTGPLPTPSGTTSAVCVDPKTVTELRSALFHMRSDEYDIWIRMGLALAELGDTGRGLWLDWSATSPKFDSKEASKKWGTFPSNPQGTSYQAVFAEAQRQGWINPSSNAAQLETVTQASFTFRYAQPGGTILETQYLKDPWLPRATVVGCYGRGEAGKSSWTAQICADVSKQVSTLWISSEERQDHILQRHISCGGQERTLAVIEAMPTKFDPKTKKPIAMSFNIFDDMERALIDFQNDPGQEKSRPVGVVVLDAVVALVTWEKGTNPNDDAGVKKLIAHLVTLAERYGVTIIMLGHLNKGTNHDHMADAVTGAAAWTNSVRLAYIFVKDVESENYEGFIRTVKSNTGTHFGATYRTRPVHVLRQRPDGHDDVLCGVKIVSETVWGERDLREMMAGEDDVWLNKREQKQQKVQLLVETTLRLLKTGGETTRKDVEALVGEKVSQRHWQGADNELHKHGVMVTKLAAGRHSYSLAKPQ